MFGVDPPMEITDAVERVCELAHTYIDPDRVERARMRHAGTLEWEDVDYLPILFGENVPELEKLPSFDWRERWYDPDKSFIEQMKGVVSRACSGSDYIPAVRADTGVINGPSLFGVDYAVPRHTKPVVTEYVPKEKLEQFELPADISGLGIVDRITEHIEHHLATLSENGLEDLVGVHHCDTQGPFDIAAQSRGHDIFTDIYTDPKFVHHVMEQATAVYIALSRLCKKLQGEPEQGGNASGYWMKQGGVRLCDDSGILVSPETFAEFNLPYQIRAFEPFGGGWVHYCGGIPDGNRSEGIHLHKLYCENPHIKGLNFTTGGDLDAEIRKLYEKGVVYIGGYPRREGEDLKDYFTRLLQNCDKRRGILFHAGFSEEDAPRAVDTWHEVQDMIFS